MNTWTLVSRITLLVSSFIALVPTVLSQIILYVRCTYQLSYPLVIVRLSLAVHTALIVIYIISALTTLSSKLALLLGFAFQILIVYHMMLVLLSVCVLIIMARQVRSNFSHLRWSRRSLTMLHRGLLAMAVLFACVPIVLGHAYGQDGLLCWLTGPISIRLLFGSGPLLAMMAVLSAAIFFADKEIDDTKLTAQRQVGMMAAAVDAPLMQLTDLQQRFRVHVFAALFFSAPIAAYHPVEYLARYNDISEMCHGLLGIVTAVLIPFTGVFFALAYLTAGEVRFRYRAIVSTIRGRDLTMYTSSVSIAPPARAAVVGVAALTLPVSVQTACLVIVMALFPVLVARDSHPRLSTSIAALLVGAHVVLVGWAVLFVFIYLPAFSTGSSVAFTAGIMFVICLALAVTAVVLLNTLSDPTRVSIRRPTFTARLTGWNLFTVVQLVLEALQLAAFPVLSSSVWAWWLQTFFRLVMLQFQYQISFVIGALIVTLWLGLVALPRAIELVSARRRYSGWIRRAGALHILLELLSGPLYFVVMRVIFSTWKCDPRGGVRVLALDPSIVCASSSHAPFLIVSLFAFAIYFPVTTLNPPGTDPDRPNASLDLKTLPMFSTSKNIVVAVISAANSAGSDACIWAATAGSATLLALTIYLAPCNLQSMNHARVVIYLLTTLTGVVTLISHYTVRFIPAAAFPVTVVLQVTVPVVWVVLPVLWAGYFTVTEPMRRVKPPSKAASTFEKERESREARKERLLSIVAAAPRGLASRQASMPALQRGPPEEVKEDPLSAKASVAVFQAARRTLRDPAHIATRLTGTGVRNRVYIERIFHLIVAETPFQNEAMDALAEVSGMDRDPSGLLAHKVALTGIVSMFPDIAVNRSVAMATRSAVLLDVLSGHHGLHVLLVRQGALAAVKAFLTTHSTSETIVRHTIGALARLVSDDIDVLLHAHKEGLPMLVLKHINSRDIEDGLDHIGDDIAGPQRMNTGSIPPMEEEEVEEATVVSVSAVDEQPTDHALSDESLTSSELYSDSGSTGNTFTDYSTDGSSITSASSGSSEAPPASTVTLNIPTVPALRVTPQLSLGTLITPRRDPVMRSIDDPDTLPTVTDESCSGSTSTLDVASIIRAFQLAIACIECLSELLRHGDDVDQDSDGGSPIWAMLNVSRTVSMALRHASAPHRPLRTAAVHLLSQILACGSGQAVMFTEPARGTLVSSLLAAATVIDKRDYDFFPIQSAFCDCLHGAATDAAMAPLITSAKSDRVAYLLVLFCASPSPTVQLAAVQAVREFARYERCGATLVTVGALDTLSMLLAGNDGRLRINSRAALRMLYDSGSAVVRRSMVVRGIIATLDERKETDSALFAFNPARQTVEPVNP